MKTLTIQLDERQASILQLSMEMHIESLLNDIVQLKGTDHKALRNEALDVIFEIRDMKTMLTKASEEAQEDHSRKITINEQDEQQM